MRATPEELLRGIQHSLMSEILPDLKDAYAQSRIPLLVMALESLIHRWDSEAQDLADENRRLAALLAEAAAVAEDVRPPCEGVSAVARQLREAAAASCDGSLSISALTSRNNLLKDAAAAFLVLCETAARRPELAPLAPLRRRLFQCLRDGLSKQWTLLPSRPPGQSQE